MKGHHPALRQFVVKVHTRCDLACDHCYVYEHADQSWQAKPKVVPSETVTRIAERIADHARSRELTDVSVILQGGEPLLAGPERLDEILTILNLHISPAAELRMKVHTNAVLLSKRYLDVFDKHAVQIGVSLDGDREANDRHRRYANGRSSYDRVVDSIELLRRYRPHLFSGILCTIDTMNDPIRVYESLLRLEPPKIDFLLPHATWNQPPPRRSETDYADWLGAIYDRWEKDARPVRIRLFDSIIRTTYGQSSLSEAIGVEPSSLVVIDTDGSYEQVDSLKVAFDGAPATGLDVFNDSLDEVAGHPGITARQQGVEGLSATCQACPVVSSCGGGLYPHRFRDNSFDHPSVYCADLFTLISHVREATQMQAHQVSPQTIETLAAGYGGEAEIRSLIGSQISIRRALITDERMTSAEPDAAKTLLDLDEAFRGVVNGVIAHPYVRVWAVSVLQGTASAGHLRNIAAAVAARAGAHLKIRADVRAGAVHLPTVGTLVDVDGDDVWIEVDEGRVRTIDGRGEWRPVRTLLAAGHSVVVEDADPYRDCHQWPAAGRLSDQELVRWQESFAAAWRLIAADYPEYLPGLRAGLTTLMPLRPDPTGRDVSSAARHAFGAVAVALPADPATLALLLIHEFQHVKLGAILDMFDLYDETVEETFYAPWRPDPRPLEGLLQGTYAHIAVADFWRRRRRVAPDPATHEFARWRAQTAEAIETLATSEALTELGDAFVARMRDTLAPWLLETLPHAVEEQARAASAAHLKAFQSQS
ncbi:FxsB family cyclophane-forming radical SAM/SPASM peptide maturase [Herbidospora cretacea]|uniref:FxsB family cyclophane-forming radical SAM/SPASM peptide maturase n=1 Tax=Herbidospora cretacea TaxID=28444 RepID=UPI0004C44653|nr:FxsB family cyclophane-forming radical SAM/SPASM peptide maturase [Herbidospora cretacea]